MGRATQRDMLSDLDHRFNGDHDRIVAAYAVAERLRRRAASVQRPRRYGEPLY